MTATASMDEAVTRLAADPLIIEMTMSMPAGFPLDTMFRRTGDGRLMVTASIAERFEFLYDIGLMQYGRPPVTRPKGAVVAAIRRVAKEIGLA